MFNNLTIRAKLLLTYGGLATMTLLVAGLSALFLMAEERRFHSYIDGINARATTAHFVRQYVDLRAIAARNLVLLTKPEDLAHEKTVVNQAHHNVGESLQRLRELSSRPGVSEQVRKMIDVIDQIEVRYAPVAMNIVDLALKGQREASIQKMNDQCLPLLTALQKATDDYAEFTAERSRKELEDAAAEFKKQLLMLVTLSVVAVVGAIVSGLLLARNLIGALGAEPVQLSSTVSGIADGDLTERLEVRDGDHASVQAAMFKMQVALTQMVSRVHESAESVSTASAQIAQGNQDLSARTESQASALQQTAASMEQLGTTVKQNADNAKQANQLAQNASTVAIQGGNVVSQVVDTMKGISDSSRKIADIIGVIDGIAFQTNILALNAAVEAARAGEQGRGFAVVAGEVRNLAGRSAEAAKEIKALITDSVGRVEQGTALVDQAGQTMNEVVASIKRVTDIMGEISAASMEQSAGVAQVGEAVTQMDQATQQNAALVEEMAAAASSLESQANDLVQTVAVFKLVHGNGQATSYSRTAMGGASSSEAKPAIPSKVQYRKIPSQVVKTAPSVSASLTPQPAAGKAMAMASEDWESF